MIETCFDKLDDIEAVSGKSASFCSKKRKNDQTAISSITKASRSMYVYKCNLIFRQYNNHHWNLVPMRPRLNVKRVQTLWKKDFINSLEL
ncbi:hypothetical protein EDC94DRAFT_593859 [Helicostylum pulchrum]|nr:hypothetical protein EDC94DRAFT_593859 [Helicostylum pulchrum]